MNGILFQYIVSEAAIMSFNGFLIFNQDHFSLVLKIRRINFLSIRINT